MARKIRSQNPPQFSDYREYKPFLRTEFHHQCAYCLTTEGELGGCKSFHIDHYRPKSRFPHQKTAYLNLYYACRDCNAYKGDYWHTFVQKALGKFIVNPCDHDPHKHFDRSQVVWKERSITGKWNISKLRLNAPVKIIRRQDQQILLDLVNILKMQRLAAEQQILLCKDEHVVTSLRQIIEDIDLKTGALERKLEGPLD